VIWLVETPLVLKLPKPFQASFCLMDFEKTLTKSQFV